MMFKKLIKKVVSKIDKKLEKWGRLRNNFSFEETYHLEKNGRWLDLYREEKKTIRELYVEAQTPDELQKTLNFWNTFFKEYWKR